MGWRNGTDDHQIARRYDGFRCPDCDRVCHNRPSDTWTCPRCGRSWPTADHAEASVRAAFGIGLDPQPEPWVEPPAPLVVEQLPLSFDS